MRVLRFPKATEETTEVPAVIQFTNRMVERFCQTNREANDRYAEISLEISELDVRRDALCREQEGLFTSLRDRIIGIIGTLTGAEYTEEQIEAALATKFGPKEPAPIADLATSFHTVSPVLIGLPRRLANQEEQVMEVMHRTGAISFAEIQRLVKLRLGVQFTRHPLMDTLARLVEQGRIESFGAGRGATYCTSGEEQRSSPQVKACMRQIRGTTLDVQ
jgi:predicted transcriptional regulator